MVKPSLISTKIINNYLNKIKYVDNNNYFLKTNIIILMLLTIFIMYLYIRYLDKQRMIKFYRY